LLTLMLSFALAETPAEPSPTAEAPAPAVLEAAGLPEAVRALPWVTHDQLEAKKRVQPAFPQSAKGAQLPDAKCIVYVHVDREGKAAGSWPTDCPSVYKEASSKALAQWTWKPPTVDGKPVEVLTTIGMSFKIR
jgi:hypothetical protein